MLLRKGLHFRRADLAREPRPGIPSTTASLIVEEDHSAPVASVQAWCATGSIDEGKWMGAGLHILEHMLSKARRIEKRGHRASDPGSRWVYQRYTSFDRTVFWIDVPAEGVGGGGNLPMP